MFNIGLYTDYCNERLTDYLPYDDNTSGEFCVFQGCDGNYTLICEALRMYPNRAYNFSYEKGNGVPSFYNRGTNEKKAPPKKQKKNSKNTKGSKTTGQGCSYCQKKRHPKDSN